MPISLLPVKIAIADDHEYLRDGFKNLITKKSNGQIQIVAEAENGVELLEKVGRYSPDVVITDIKMPTMDGFEVCRKINEQFPTIPVIAFSMFDESATIYDMILAGARGYLLKNSPAHEVIEAIQTVNNGNTYYCSASAKSLANLVAGSKYDPRSINSSVKLSDIEINVIRKICHQQTTKEIATDLHMSEKTVEQYSRKIKSKTRTKNLAGMALFAVKNSIVKIEDIDLLN